MRDLKLTEDQLAELYKLHKSLKDKKSAYRINIIVLLHKGYTYKEIHEILMIDEKTVRRYKDSYLHRGINGLLEDNYTGGQSKLSKEQEDELAQHLQEKIFATAAEVRDFVEKRYGIKYTTHGIVHTLHRLGFSYKKTKLVPSKADKEKQEAFIQAYQELRKNQKTGEKVYFMDGVHPTHNAMPAYAWIKKGTEKEIKSNSGRQRMNLNGVYSPDDGEIIVRSDEAINSQSTIRLLEMIEKKHPELDKIFIIRDNARYYVSKEVQAYLKDSRIVFIPLPSYSPNLNLIERLWKFFKKKKMYNAYYETFDIFQKEVLKFFRREIKSYKSELRSLMAEHFHVFSMN